MKKKILIVDDSPNCRKMYTLILEDEWEIIKAEDGTEGIEIAKTQKPDLILLDVVMPGLSGFEVIEKLKENSITKKIPFIIISGNTDAIKKAQELGLSLLEKPISREELIATVSEFNNQD